MTGLPDANRPAFNAAAKVLRSFGLEVVNPAELDISHPVPDLWVSYMSRDIRYLSECNLGIALPGWKGSKGAVIEIALLRALGRQVLQYPSIEPIPDDEAPEIILP